MHKVMCAAVITALFATVPAASQAQGQAFVNLTAGQTRHHVRGPDSNYYDTSDFPGLNYHHDVDKSDLALGVTGGYRWMIDDVFSVGPEVGLVDLGSLETHSSSSVPAEFDETTHSKIATTAALVGINSRWLLGGSSQWSLTARTGLIHTRTRLHAGYTDVEYYGHPATAFSASQKNTSIDNGFYGALSIGYDLSRDFGVSVGYERYHSDFRTGHHISDDSVSLSQDIGMWAASAEFRF